MISLLVPTINRSDFVKRLLLYYESQHYEAPILIGDSSNDKEFAKTAALVEGMSGRLQITHLHLPGLGNYAAVARLMEHVTTPYSAFLPDDDFLVPSSMKRFAEFLDQNPDYSCAWGKSIRFTLEGDDLYGPLQNSQVNPTNIPTQFSLDQNTPEARFKAHLEKYTSVFIGCCRTSMFRRALACAVELHNLVGERKEESWRMACHFSELIVSLSLVAQGKVKSLDYLHWVRQIHGRRYTYGRQAKLVLNPFWSMVYQRFLEIVVQEFEPRGSLSVDEWKELINESFAHQIETAFRNKVMAELQYNQLHKKVLRKLEHFEAVKMFKARLISNPFALNELLDQGSKYHQAFMPIYELICLSQTNKHL